MLSPGHRENILHTTMREISVGYYFDATDTSNIREDLNGDSVVDSFGNGPFTNYWTQNFGRRANVYPVVINREAYETASQTVNLYVYGVDSDFPFFTATEMRFRNDTGVFSAWEPYNESKVWVLSSGAGVKEVFVEIKNAGGTVRSESDTIIFLAPGPAADFNTVSPFRLIDTRNGVGPQGGLALMALQDRTFTIANNRNVPLTVVAVSVNIAVTGATAGGNLRLHAGGASPSSAATIKYAAGQTKSNNAIVPLHGSGQLAVFTDQPSGTTVDLIHDINGYFE
jgi:hypothetical protein